MKAKPISKLEGTLHVSLRLSRPLQARLRVGMFLIKLGAQVIGLGCEIYTPYDDNPMKDSPCKLADSEKAPSFDIPKPLWMPPAEKK
jgi:hypothetical protein